jgi:hypothetical protein
MTQITKMLGRYNQGFVDINAMALNAAINGSILAEPDACFVIMMALPFGSMQSLFRKIGLRVPAAPHFELEAAGPPDPSRLTYRKSTLPKQFQSEGTCS